MEVVSLYTLQASLFYPVQSGLTPALHCCFQDLSLNLSVVALACNMYMPGVVEAGGLETWGQPDYITRPCLKNKTLGHNKFTSTFYYYLLWII